MRLRTAMNGPGVSMPCVSPMERMGRDVRRRQFQGREMNTALQRTGAIKPEEVYEVTRTIEAQNCIDTRFAHNTHLEPDDDLAGRDGGRTSF